MYKKYLEENANSSITFKGNKSEINENTTKDNDKSVFIDIFHKWIKNRRNTNESRFR